MKPSDEKEISPVRQNIFVLNCGLLGENDKAFWNSLFESHDQQYAFKFFSTSIPDDIEADECIEVSYETPVLIRDSKISSPQLEALIRQVAQKDQIWETYQAGRSEDLAYSWLMFWTIAIRVFRPVGVIVWNGHHIPEAALAKACQLEQVDCTYAERGPLAGTYALDRLGVNVKSAFVANYEDIEVSESVERIETFAQLYFDFGISNWDQPKAFSEREEFLDSLNIPRESTVIFFPSQVDLDTNSKLYSPHFHDSYDALCALTDWCNRNASNIYLLAKKHPMQDNKDDWSGITFDSGRWVEDIHIFDCIKYCDCVVSINSSSAIEAALIGKPTLLLGQSMLQRWEHVLKLSSRNALEDRLEQLISIARQKDPLPNSKFFSRLLFGYLYSNAEQYIELGLKPPSQWSPEISHITGHSNTILENQISVLEYLVPSDQSATTRLRSLEAQLAAHAETLQRLSGGFLVRLFRKLGLIRVE